MDFRGVAGRARVCLFSLWERVGDAWVGWHEARVQKQGRGPSRRALSEIMAYYTRAVDGGPDPDSFLRSLRRNGVPDWPNPFPEGQEEHYLFHPLGFLAADVETIAMGWARQPFASTGGEATLPSPWPTVEQAAISAYRARLREDDTARALARVCWAMAVQAGSFPRLSRVIHPDNLVAATADAVLRGPLAQFDLDPDVVWAAAQRSGLAPGLKAADVWARMGGPDPLATPMSDPVLPTRETIRQKNELDRLWREADARDRRRFRDLPRAWWSLAPMAVWFALLPFVSFEVGLVSGVIMVAIIAVLAGQAWKRFVAASSAPDAPSLHQGREPLRSDPSRSKP